ncbi:unnamed protein product, partial [Owenia fusiformis]
EEVSELSGSKKLNLKANAIKEKYEELNTLFYNIHSKVLKCEPVTEKDIDIIHENIDIYMSFYRTHFPNKVLPKHHFLEAHICQWMSSKEFQMGLHGEQGGEGIHREFKRIETNMAHMRNESKRLMMTM